MSAYVSICQQVWVPHWRWACTCAATCAYVSIRQHTSAYVSHPDVCLRMLTCVCVCCDLWGREAGREGCFFFCWREGSSFLPALAVGMYVCCDLWRREAVREGVLLFFFCCDLWGRQWWREGGRVFNFSSLLLQMLFFLLREGCFFFPSSLLLQMLEIYWGRWRASLCLMLSTLCLSACFWHALLAADMLY
jgi:hypothetical protein